MLFILLISFKLEGQYQFDFEIDSSGVEEWDIWKQWEQFPEDRWCCDSLQTIEGASSLHHCFDNPEEGCDYMVLKHEPINFTDSFSVSFRIRHAYAPSSQNNWQLAVAAELSDLGESSGGEPQILSGIVVGVNYTGSDDLVKIWGVHEGAIEEWCASSLNYQEQVGTILAPLLRLDWDGSGRLALFASLDPLNQPPELIAVCHPEDMPMGRELILRYRYTSSRDRALWMDKLLLEGNLEKDTISPVLKAVEVVDGHRLRLGFSERVLTPLPGMFTLYTKGGSGGLSPDSIGELEQGVLISFLNEIPNRLPCQLHLWGVEDVEGNLLRDTLVPLMRNEAVWGDLVFNELMVDPNPPVLHDVEYLEAGYF